MAALGALNEIRSSLQARKSQPTCPTGTVLQGSQTCSIETKFFLTKQQCEAQSDSDLDRADEAALEQAITESKQSLANATGMDPSQPTNNLHVDRSLRDFDAICSQRVNEHIQGELERNGYKVVDNPGSGDNCVFYSIAAQLVDRAMNQEDREQAIQTYAQLMREAFNHRQEFAGETGMIHLDGATAQAIAQIASEEFGKPVTLTVGIANPDKYVINESVVERIHDRLNQIYNLEDQINAEAALNDPDTTTWDQIRQLLHAANQHDATKELIQICEGYPPLALNTYSSISAQSHEPSPSQKVQLWNQGNHVVGVEPMDLGNTVAFERSEIPKSRYSMPGEITETRYSKIDPTTYKSFNEFKEKIQNRIDIAQKQDKLHTLPGICGLAYAINGDKSLDSSLIAIGRMATIANRDASKTGQLPELSRAFGQFLQELGVVLAERGEWPEQPLERLKITCTSAGLSDLFEQANEMENT
ncbi:hypothetical protein AWB78_08506 [Caballeronia calidae]|uniref:Uncharacterized protein n=1 Tax=Caballeronia calidae TaxID=1777139 RepID=A0A158EK89_9BURK|nr:hypothetical protein AWB78_08506 [Caballeronia calidae]